MSFGYSASELVLVTQLAWKTYKACKAAPGSFANLVQDTQSLHAILQETEEIVKDGGSKITAAQHRRLEGIVGGCRSVLHDLDKLLQKYESLGTQSKRSWDRMGYAMTDISELRSRLSTQAVLLSSFIQTSQFAVEQKLHKLIKEIQQGKHEGSQLSFDSLTGDERLRWREIRKQLEAVGITIAAFEENSAFIIDYINKAITAGELQEKAPEELVPTSRATSRSGDITRGKASKRLSPLSPLKLTRKTTLAVKSPPVQAPLQIRPQIKDYKVLLLGISEAGKTTVLNQFRAASSSHFHPAEYNDCRRVLWENLILNFKLIANKLSEELSSSITVQNAIKTVQEAPETMYEDETFPVDVMDALHTLWDEPIVRAVVRRGLDIGLADNLEYLYKSMERVANPWDPPSADDILNIRVKTLGIAETVLNFDRKTFRIFDVPGERAGRKKWRRCAEGESPRCVTLVASLTSYCSTVENIDPPTQQLEENIGTLNLVKNEKWFPESIYVLFLTKLDLFGERLRNYPLDEHEFMFSYQSYKNNDPLLTSQSWKENYKAYALAFIANKFVDFTKQDNRILQVHCIDATRPTSQECLKESLDFISRTVPRRPLEGKGLLVSCPHCHMGDLFTADGYVVPAGGLSWGSCNTIESMTQSDNQQQSVASRAASTSEYPAEERDTEPLTFPCDDYRLATPQSVDWSGIHVQEVKTTELL